MKKNFVDIHCHYFNGKFAFKESLEIGWRKFIGNYPYNRNEKKMKQRSISLSYELKTVVEYVASFFSILTASEEKNYQYEQNSFKKSKLKKNYTSPIITSPLMMDIYFVLDNGDYLEKTRSIKELSESEYRQTVAPLKISKEEEEEFKAFAQKLKEEVLRTVREKQPASGMKSKAMDPLLKDAESVLDDVIAKFIEQDEDERVVKRGTAPVQLTKGFSEQLKNMKNLKNRYPETTFPFFAVDPRRVGIAHLLEENLKNGTFAGVKLYPPLGYLPTHPDLYPIYDLCLKYDVPVTAHCSPGGFHTHQESMKTESLDRNGNRTIEDVVVAKGYELSKCTDEKCRYFADPDNWVEILKNKKYKDLRINLAHFGGDAQFEKYINDSAEKENWTAKIIKLIKQYDNLYTDLSYNTNKDVSKGIEKVLEKHSFLKDRLMFGTDYIMILLDYKLTHENDEALVDYFNHFEKLTESLSSINALRFLGKS